MFFAIKPAEKVNFVKNLSVMIRSGIPLDEALSELAAQTGSTKLKAVIMSVKEDVSRGSSLSSAFAKHSTFDGVFNALVRTGEASGTLEENLIFLAEWLEHENDMKKNISSATLYPKIVIGAVVILAVGLNLFVLPKLLPLFADLNVELPWATKAMFAISNSIRAYWHIALALITLIAAAAFVLRRLPPIRALLDAAYLRIPFFGKLTTDYEMAVISQLFYTCFKSTLSMQESISIIESVLTQTQYRASFARIAERVQTGSSLGDSMKLFPRLYPRQVISIISTGEKSGTLSEAFRYLSEFYSKEVQSKTKNIPTVIEPLLLLFIALMIGFIAFSVIVPIYSISTSI